MEIDYSLPQSDYILSGAEYCAAVAGFGSGKTKAAASKILVNKLNYPTIDQAYLAPTYSLIKSIFYPVMIELLVQSGFRPRKDFVLNKSDHEIHIQGYGSILCRTMDDPDMIVGWEVGDAVMDEFDLLPTEKAKQVMTKVSGRCRQKFPDGKQNQKGVTTTPEGFKATYELFEKDPLPNSQLIQMSTYSNAANLPEGYIESRIAQYPAKLVDAYIEGKFVNLTSGSVYPCFNRKVNNTHYVAKPREPLHIGMDFNVYKMFAGVHIIRDGVPHLVHEFTGVRDTPAIIEAIQEEFPDHSVIVYPDASGDNKSSKSASLSDIVLLRAAGFHVDCPTKNPLVKNRVNSVNAKFYSHGSPGYFVNVEKCPVSTLAFEQQVYDKNGQPDKSSDLDHPVDGCGYFIHRKWPLLTSISDVVATTSIAEEVNHAV